MHAGIIQQSKVVQSAISSRRRTRADVLMCQHDSSCCSSSSSACNETMIRPAAGDERGDDVDLDVEVQ